MNIVYYGRIVSAPTFLYYSMNNLPKRKPNRLKNFDYSTNGMYFITVCTHNRKCILSEINVGDGVLDVPQLTLYNYGKIIDKYINQLNDFYNDICVDKYVIMPNHIHLLISVIDNGASRTSPPTVQHSAVSRFVSTFKRFCNKEYGMNVWQRHFYDHVIRNQRDYDEIWQYIDNNPCKWVLQNDNQ